MRVVVLFFFFLVLFYSLARKRRWVRLGREKHSEIFEEQHRESDINAIVMPSRDFETIAGAMSEAVIYLPDFWINIQRGAAFCCVLGNSKVQSFYRN